MRVAVAAKVGARGTDSVQAVGGAHAAALRASGIDFCVRYLGSATPEEVTDILAAGLAFMPVTFADKFDGDSAVAELEALGVVKGTSVWLDVEGKSVYAMQPAELIATITRWCDPVSAAGYMPCLYVGAPQPLTSTQLYQLPTQRYWRGQGRVVDVTGRLAEPTCGWCMTQAYPSQMWAGCWVDLDFVGQDYEGRVPVWMVNG